MRGITVKPKEKFTEIKFSRNLLKDYDLLMKQAKEQMKFKGYVAFVNDSDFTSNWRISTRLCTTQRQELLKLLYKLCDLGAPKMRPENMVPKKNRITLKTKSFKSHKTKTAGSTICGFIGNLIFGDLQYLYK